jgi:signal transduction histidine kinase
MAAATERMQRLIVDLLAYARSGRAPTPPQPVTLVGAVRAAVDDLAAAATERGVQPTVDLPDGAAVMAEPVAVAQVVRNLLANALKFADATAPEVAVSAERADGRWRVVVADNGAGVPEDKRAAIFEPFTQLRRDDFGGTGLGLSICRRLVARHGGTIGVQPRQGGGSAFWFELPAA